MTGVFLKKRCLTGALFFLGCLFFSNNLRADGTLLYKNYIVRYDRGWDILCEPYTVHQNDWVYKIFRQKGEISHLDFNDFLGIFARLNPHIVNIDMIRPGQKIDIPLKKLEEGALPNQSSGVVIIPFVSISEIVQKMEKFINSYEVVSGDCVSRLVSLHFGVAYGSKTYNEGVKLLQALNPKITDLNKIYKGQKIYLPDPLIRQQSWYASFSDNLDSLSAGPLAPDEKSQAAAQTATRIAKQTIKTAVKADKQATSGIFGFSLAQTAGILDGQLKNKGTYFFPLKDQKGQKDLELDLSRNPILELQNGRKIIFNNSEQSMDPVKRNLLAEQKNVSLISVSKKTSVEQILGAVFANDSNNNGQSKISFASQGVNVIIKARWITTLVSKSDNIKRYTCITPIKSQKESTPDFIQRYLDQNNIIIKEVLPDTILSDSGKQKIKTAATNKNISQLIPIPLDMADHKTFVKKLLSQLGFAYTPNTSITFPYAGIQLKAFSNLVSPGPGKEFLIDFGDLYGDAIISIKQSGLKIIQILAADDHDLIIEKLLKALGISYTTAPTFLAAQRPEAFNVAITIRGYLIEKLRGTQALITDANLHDGIIKLIKQKGIVIIPLQTS